MRDRVLERVGQVDPDGRIHRGYLFATVSWLFVVSRVIEVFVHFG